MIEADDETIPFRFSEPQSSFDKRQTISDAQVSSSFVGINAGADGVGVLLHEAVEVPASTVSASPDGQPGTHPPSEVESDRH